MMKRFLLIVLLAAGLVVALAVAQDSAGDAHQKLATGSNLPASPTASMAGAIAGNESAIASATGDTWPATAGDHFHSDDSGIFGNPPDLAETGGFSAMGDLEEVRGLAEFDLSGQGTLSSAELSFTVLQLGGLFGQEPGTFDVEVSTFDGNNTEDVADFSAPSTENLGSFSTAGLQVDDLLTFDITDAYNSAVSRDIPALGVRLQASTDPGIAAFVFGEFELAPAGVPTTPPWALVVLVAMFVVLGVLLLVRRRV